MLKKFIVYKHTCPNGKIYIGMTSRTLSQRRRSGYWHNPRFLSDIQRYGWSQIKSEILCEELDYERAKQKEIGLIAKYNATDPAIGYNISIGGESHRGCSFHHSDETKKKISKHNARYWLGTQGARYGKTSLNQDDVDYIKANYERNSKSRGLRYFANKFGVSTTIISQVVNGKYCGDIHSGGGAAC